MSADEAYDRLHGADGHTQARGRTRPPQADVDALRELLDLMGNFPDNDQRARYLLSCDWMRDRDARVAEFQWNALEMARKADIAEARAEGAEVEVEQLRDVLAEVRAVFNLQCPPMPPEKYVDHGAWVAHSWWSNVLGNVLRRAVLLDELSAAAADSADCPGICGEHHWLDRPESDTKVCEICGAER